MLLTAPYRHEYDREQDAILEGQSRGLGLKGEWKGVSDWYGGRIEQTVRLSKVNDTFTYRLVRPALKKSTRFARFLGSRRILKIKLPKNLRFEKDSGVIDHLSGSFVLCGRVFVPFAYKEGNVHMMEVNEDEDRKPDGVQGDDARMSLWDFIQWHNPFALNENQVWPLRCSHILFLSCSQALSKWSSRFDLGLSTTVPVVQFEPRNIMFIEDIRGYPA
jgi:RNA-dependent RNA polymerase